MVTLETGVPVDGTLVSVHCQCLVIDANGKTRVDRLAEFMRDALIDYAIPKSKIDAARVRDEKYKSGAAMSRLHHEARNAFTDLDTSGEGGELLLFLLAERYLKIPQVLCKMDLKTDSRMHYHGADGVYATVSQDGILNLFWGESKLYQDAADAIRECLRSLAPFLAAPENEGAERERDLLLLSDKADLNDPLLTAAFKKYFDKSSPLSTRVKYSGVALVGFDAKCYPDEAAVAVAQEVQTAAKEGMQQWLKNVRNRAVEEKLQHFAIEFICVPLPSVEKFRAAFKKALGLS